MKPPFIINRFGKLQKRKKGIVYPLFEIVSNPTIRITDIKRRRFDLIDRVKAVK